MAKQGGASKREVEAAAKELQSVKGAFEDNPPESYEHKEDVLDVYADQFSQQKISDLSEEKFREFLLFENNKHWTGLHRKREMMTKDMELLRENLSRLVDDSKPLGTRVQATKEAVDGMGKATLSAILLTSDHTEYGVWNNRSEEALKQLDIWPTFERGTSFGDEHVEVNSRLQQLGNEVQVDMWDLDALLGFYVENKEPEEPQTSSTPGAEFAKEQHLQEYLVSHWEQTNIGKDWEIYANSEDPQAGVEFSTGIGRPDLLLVHSSDDRVRVIELKRSRTSDKAVGQIMRYIGWVRQNLDELEGVSEKSSVDGVIIGGRLSEKFEHAVSAYDDIAMLEYDIEVNLAQPEETTPH